jgi:hypothetical protein
LIHAEAASGGSKRMTSLMEELETIAANAGWSSEALLRAIAWWFENNDNVDGLVEHLRRLAMAEAIVPPETVK